MALGILVVVTRRVKTRKPRVGNITLKIVYGSTL